LVLRLVAFAFGADGDGDFLRPRRDAGSGDSGTAAPLGEQRRGRARGRLQWSDAAREVGLGNRDGRRKAGEAMAIAAPLCSR